MPAVTVEDTTTLPRVPAPAPGTVRRRVRSVTTAPSGFEGEGFPVRRAFAGVDLRDLDPFIHMDQMGEVEYAPGEPKGTSWHPHRGFETVTYIIDGTFEHADSHGGGGTISNGDTQWMTAGSGLLHIEAPPEWMVQQGGLFHGIQLWVNLPRKDKFAVPRYQAIEGGEVKLLSSDDGGALVRIIAGDVTGDDAKEGAGVGAGQQHGLVGAQVLVARLDPLLGLRQVDPQLQAVEQAAADDQVLRRPLDVQKAAARRHPLRVAVGDHAPTAVAVLVLERAVHDVGDGLEAAVRMP